MRCGREKRRAHRELQIIQQSTITIDRAEERGEGNVESEEIFVGYINMGEKQ